MERGVNEDLGMKPNTEDYAKKNNKEYELNTETEKGL